ncbi:FAD-binding oxidoreductase [Jiella sp. MQZ9-1]|uniref:FAD-binding oxidoreductase n=1 Tax=Jiella flava TaxID=2816857 RepID=A0A939FW17_9HYPH|nr:FAD-binding oxidoreductase [Jiella flava]MBO0662562.1 FAD-binding oxidoreductase [Jiella flava]MCD2472933.1 FAD-binding oxidoreductase [Jiella flava]
MQVVIIGGGLMGTTTAFYLARRGIHSTLIERHQVGRAATGASFGNIRRQGRFLPQLPLAHHSRALWGDAERLLGENLEFRVTGHLRLVFDVDSVSDMETYAKDAEPWGLTLELFDLNELRRRFPWAGSSAIAASLSPQDASANPPLVAPAFARAAARLGANILENTPVDAIRQTAHGFCVETPAGAIAADVVVNAAGAWGARLAERFGEPVPLEPYGPQMGMTEPLAQRIPPVVGLWSRIATESAYFRQIEGGNIIFGGGLRAPAALDPGDAHADPARTLAQLPLIERLCPALAPLKVIRTWAACEGYSRDMLPVMGPSQTTPGLFHAFGFCGHGFQLGPGVGDVMAELITTGRSETSIEPFSIARFAG